MQMCNGQILVLPGMHNCCTENQQATPGTTAMCNEKSVPETCGSKDSVISEKLESFVLMPDELDTAFVKWRELLPASHIVRVRYPHEHHGLAGKTSNNAKV